MVKLLELTGNKPLFVRARGEAWTGLEWVVRPENFPKLITMINNNGGPDFWELREATAEELEAHA